MSSIFGMIGYTIIFVILMIVVIKILTNSGIWWIGGPSVVFPRPFGLEVRSDFGHHGDQNRHDNFRRQF